MVKRYTCAVRNGPNGIYAEMAVRDNGAFVLTEDYEALAARLTTVEVALDDARLALIAGTRAERLIQARKANQVLQAVDFVMEPV